MAKQRKLFLADEKREKEQEMQRRAREEAREARRREREAERERVKAKKRGRKPKAEFYRCDCGLILHWRVAYGRRSGCPQCNGSIPISEIFM